MKQGSTASYVRLGSVIQNVPQNNIGRAQGALGWIQRGSFAVLDQGLFAASNFLTNILLARWLEPREYGVFAVAFSVFLLLGSVHTALLTEPMLVHGAGKYAEKFRRYLGLLIYGHFGVTGLIASILILVALGFWLSGYNDLAYALAGLSIASPLILFLWLVRRAFYVRLQPHWSAIGGILYLLFMLVGMYGLYYRQWLSAASALIVMGFASLLVSLWFTTLHRPQWRFVRSNPLASMVYASHLEYGRWSVPIVALTWFSSSAYWILLPAWAGVEAIAVLQAVTNLVMPVLQAMTAVSVLLLPMFARQLKTHDTVKFQRSVEVVAILFLLGSATYFLCLMMFGGHVMNWVYKERYSDYNHLLIIAGLLPFAYAANFVVISGLKAMGHLSEVFKCYAFSAMLTLTLGTWLVAYHGLIGAIVGWFCSSGTAGIIAYYFFRKRIRRY